MKFLYPLQIDIKASSYGCHQSGGTSVGDLGHASMMPRIHQNQKKVFRFSSSSSCTPCFLSVQRPISSFQTNGCWTVSCQMSAQCHMVLRWGVAVRGVYAGHLPWNTCPPIQTLTNHEGDLNLQAQVWRNLCLCLSLKKIICLQEIVK